MNRQLFFVFVLFLLLALFYYYIIDFDIDALYTKNAFECGQECLPGFRFPLLYYATIPFYWLLGSLTFIALPLLFFFSGAAYLSKLIGLLKMPPIWTFILFLPAAQLPMFLIHYTRDSLNFLLACAFAYYFIGSWYYKKSFIPPIIIAGLMLFSLPAAIVFAMFCAILVTKKSIDLANNGGLAFLLLPLDMILKEAKYLSEQLAQRLLHFKLEYLINFYYPFFNFFNGLALLCLLISKNKLFAMIFVVSIFVSGITVMVINGIYPDPNPEQLAARYGLSFFPLLYYFVAETIKTKMEVGKWNNWIILK